MDVTYLYGNIGVTNTVIGTDALANVTSGADNTAFGTNTYKYLSTGDGNSGFGINVASNLSANPSTNSAFGTEVNQNITSAANVSSFGYRSLLNVTTGGNNSGFGANIAPTLTTGTGNTLCGANADVASSNTVDSVGIGSGEIGLGTSTYCEDGDVIVGHGCRSLGGNTVKIGSEILSDEFALSQVVMGHNAGGDENFSHFGEVILGDMALSEPNPAYAFGPSTSESTIIGAQSARYIVQSFSDTVVGYEAFQNSYVNNLAVIIGCRAAQLPTQGFVQGANNDCTIGYEAGLNSFYDLSDTTAPAGDPPDSNCVIGAFCGHSLTSERHMTCVGYQCMERGKGADNVAIGYRAMRGPVSYNITDAAPGTAVGAGKMTAVTKVLDGSVAFGEIIDLDFTGATPAGMDGVYFLVSSASRDYYVWYNLDSGSIDPMVGGRIGIEVAIATGDLSTNIADNTRLKFLFDVNDFTTGVGFTGGVLDVTNNVNGNVTDIASGTSVGSYQLISVTKLADGTAGTPEMNRIDCGGCQPGVLSSTYFLISSTTTDYYAWFNWDSVNSDPGPGGLNLPALVGKTGIQIDIVSDDIWYEVTQRIMTALNGTGEFTASMRNANFIRLVVVDRGDNNVAIGNNAFTAITVGRDNVVLGSDAALALEDGINNVLIGRSVNSVSGTQRAVVVGGGAITSANDTTVVGAGANATASEGIAIGSGASVASVGSCQLAPAVASGTGILRYRTQIVSDESWIGGGSTTMTIDNNGSINRSVATSYAGSTTDATPLNLISWVTANDTVRRVEALVIGRRTGGTMGAVNDSASYHINVALKNDGGVLTAHIVNAIILEDQPAWDATFIVAGTTAHLQVTGAANNDIDWDTKIRTYVV